MLDRINEAYRCPDALCLRRQPRAAHPHRASSRATPPCSDRWGKDDPAARQEAIDAIRAEADSMEELVEQLLFLARGDNDSHAQWSLQRLGPDRSGRRGAAGGAR